MSKPRYDWWSYVKGMIRRYPVLKARYADFYNSSLATEHCKQLQLSGEFLPGAMAIRELPTTNQREYESIRRAIEATEQYRNGRERLQVVRRVLWDKSHTLEGAALKIPCSYDTAQRYHEEFIKLVAAQYGLMDF